MLYSFIEKQLSKNSNFQVYYLKVKDKKKFALESNVEISQNSSMIWKSHHWTSDPKNFQTIFIRL